jgi:ubiquinone biosynthesis protein UbiJ
MAGSNLLPELFAALLSEAMERFLRLAPNSRHYLAPMAGKVIALRFAPFDGRIYLCPSETTIEVFPSFETEPDVSFTGSPLAFVRMGLGGVPRRALFAGEVVVEGDMNVARRFQRLFEKLDMDWEGLFSRIVGRGLAANIFSGLRDSHAWRVETVEALQLNTAEYLQEESRELPATFEAEVFYRDVDTLRADCDRLEARLLRLGEKATVQSAIEGNGS